MNVQPFTLLGDSVLRQASAALAPILAAWTEGWGIPAPQLRVLRACDAVLAGARWSAPTPARGLWFCWHADWQAELQRLMFGAEAGFAADAGAAPELAPAAARAAAAQLADALCGALPGQDAAAPADAYADTPGAAHFRRGAGTLVVLIQLGRVESRLLLDAASVQALCPTPAPALPPLAPLNRRAQVAATPVTLQLAAGSARVGLGSLMSLSPGDVIRLDRSADAPLPLCLAPGVPVLHAHLGRIGASIALELTSLK